MGGLRTPKRARQIVRRCERRRHEHRRGAGGRFPGSASRATAGDRDLDTTDLPLHGHQERRFFHGFYYHYCYLPLYIVCGERLLGVRLRPADSDASAGAQEEVERIV